MADKFIDPKTGKEMFKINDSNQESFSDEFKKKLKDKKDGTSDHNDRESGSGTEESTER